MRTIRRNVFETNSSSTHSMAIPTGKVKYGKVVFFNIDEFGWEFDEADPADYLYTAIYTYFEREEAERQINRLKHALESHGIEYKMSKVKWKTSTYNNGSYQYVDNGYIDHSDALGEFLTNVLDSEENMLNFIFGGHVYTGNDNADGQQMAFVYRNEPTYTEYDYDRETKKYVSTEHENPHYISEGYEWYFKGN